MQSKKDATQQLNKPIWPRRRGPDSATL